MAAILSSRIFLLEVIPEVEYTRNIAMSISDILSFSDIFDWRSSLNIDGDI